MDIINYTDLRTNLKHWMNKVSDDMIGLVIKRKKDNDLVLIPLSEYNSLTETAYLMTGKNRDVLLKSIKQLESADIVEGELID